MEACVISLLLGIMCIVLGISHTKGNLSSLHSYHRKRVSEEDRLPFGKRVGVGTIIIGGSLVLYSVLYAVTIATEQQAFVQIGTVVMVAGLVAGLALSFYAMFKYNKGIF